MNALVIKVERPFSQSSAAEQARRGKSGPPAPPPHPYFSIHRPDEVSSFSDPDCWLSSFRLWALLYCET